MIATSTILYSSSSKLLFFCLISYLPPEAWLTESRRLAAFLEKSLQRLLANSNADLMRRVQLLRRTQIEHEVQRAMCKFM